MVEIREMEQKEETAGISGSEVLTQVYARLLRQKHRRYELQVALETVPKIFEWEKGAPLHYAHFALLRLPQRSWLLGQGNCQEKDAPYVSDIMGIEIASPELFTLAAWQQAVPRCRYLSQSLVAAKSSGVLVFPSPGSSHLARLVETELMDMTRASQARKEVCYAPELVENFTEKMLTYLKGH